MAEPYVGSGCTQKNQRWESFQLLNGAMRFSQLLEGNDNAGESNHIWTIGLGYGMFVPCCAALMEACDGRLIERSERVQKPREDEKVDEICLQKNSSFLLPWHLCSVCANI